MTVMKIAEKRKSLVYDMTKLSQCVDDAVAWCVGFEQEEIPSREY